MLYLDNIKPNVIDIQVSKISSMFDFEPSNINMIKDKKEFNVFGRILNTRQNNCCD